MLSPREVSYQTAVSTGRLLEGRMREEDETLTF